MPQVEVVRDPTPEVADAVRRLLPQLSGSARPPTDAEVAEIACGGATTLFLAHGPGPGATGMLTLASFRIPTGLRAWVEDVVVDVAVRGQGIGEALLVAAVDFARQQGALTVDLTSRPAREAANRLYLRAGFQLRDTNVYRLDLRRAREAEPGRHGEVPEA